MIFGGSLYLQTFDLEYLKKIEGSKITSLFTSLHVPEDDFDQVKLEKMLEFSKNSNINLMVDVSPVTLEKLNVKDILELKKYNIKQIRLDYGFDDVSYVKTLSESFEVVLNASIVKEDYIKKMKDCGIDFNKIKALHNFYPKINSALDAEKFLKINKMIKENNIEVYAFVAGDELLRYPTFEGLVTLEKHRGVNPYIATLDLMKNFNVDGVFYGDGTLSKSSLELITKFMNEPETIHLKATLEKDYEHLYGEKIQIRLDSNNRCIRLNTRDSKPVIQKNVLLRNKLSINITNSCYHRYANEIEIAGCDLGFDFRFNNIGYVNQSQAMAVEFLSDFRYIVFEK